LRSPDKIKDCILNLMSAGVLIYNNVVGAISHMDFDLETGNGQMITMIDGNGK